MLFVIIHSTSAQWFPGTNKITTTDRIGIGELNPATKLHVTGSGSSTGTEWLTLIDPQGNSGTGGSILLGQSDGAPAIQAGANNNLALQPTGGKVGIGVTTPNAVLTVQGGGVTTGLANINTTLTARYNTANIPIVLGVGYVSSDNPFLQTFNSTTGTGRNLILNPFGGGVGIGTSSPASLFSVGRSSQFQVRNSGSMSMDVDSALQSQIAIGNGYGERHGLTILGNGSTGFTSFGLISTGTKLSFSTAGPLIGPDSDLSTGWTERMTFLPNGDVGIGTATPTTKLAVNGTIRSKEVRVESGPWPDYVLKPNYKLSTLGELKAYIDKHHRLPEMPSEKEVEQNGIALGEIVKLQTKKIEELTLYLIEKDKEVKDQQNTIIQQEARLKALEKHIKLK